MGKATIISEQGEGLYTIQPEWNTSIAVARVASLTAENSAIDTRLGTIDGEISAAEFDYNYATDVLRAAIINEKPEAEIEAKQRDVLTKETQWQELRRTKSFVQLKKTANLKQIEFINQQTATPAQIQAWCADYTEEMTGVVGTIEVGRVDTTPIIKPGFEAGAGAVFADDGQLTPLLSNSPAATFWNLAMLPGAAKWKPLYRIGTASGVDKEGSTMSVNLDALTIAGINCNAESTLTGIPVVYMDCHAEAFENGDKVVVDMRTTPTVIGFETQPAICCPEITISGTDAPEVGAEYTIMGGEPPYTITHSENITLSEPVLIMQGEDVVGATVEITAIEECPEWGGVPRIGTITVVNDCEQTAEMELRLPGGYWRNRQSMGCGPGLSCPDTSRIYDINHGKTHALTEDVTIEVGRYQFYLRHVVWMGTSHICEDSIGHSLALPFFGETLGFAGAGCGHKAFISLFSRREWWCL